MIFYGTPWKENRFHRTHDCARKIIWVGLPNNADDVKVAVDVLLYLSIRPAGQVLLQVGFGIYVCVCVYMHDNCCLDLIMF